MKGTKKFATMMLAMMLALSLCGFAMAEEGTEDTTGNSSAAAESLKAAEEKNQALSDALTAYSNAKQESRKQSRLASLKEELDGYVAAGSMTQEQADLLLSYYAEQLVQNPGDMGKGRGGKSIGNGGRNGMKNRQNMPQNGFGREGKRGGMNQQVLPMPQGGNDTMTSEGTGI